MKIRLLNLKKIFSWGNFKFLKLAPGFSIIEITLVLTIIGIITFGTLRASNTQIETVRYNQTLQKFKLLHEAIEAFVLINKRLPCPANALIPLSNSTAGNEYCTGTVSVSASSVPATIPVITDTVVIGGAVPFKSLMLPVDVSLDGWGNKITYAVSKGLTASINGFDSMMSGIIKINQYSGSLINNRAAYILLSHGVSGKGSWTRSGSRIEAGSVASKCINAHTPACSSPTWDEIFVLNLSSKYYYMPSNWPNFDDILEYRTKEQILFNLGLTYSGPGCDSAYTALTSNDQTATRICNGTGGNANGTESHPYCNEYLLNLATEAKKRCLSRIK